MKKQEILDNINKISEQLKDNVKFIDLMRDEDDPKKTLADLRRNVAQLLLLVEASDIKEMAHPKNEMIKQPLFGGKSGDLVAVRMAGNKYGKKTFIGFLLGDVATGSSMTIEDDKIQCNWSGHNPGMFVPELGRIVYGYESWWGKIKDEDHLRKITDEDIENVWYMKLWKEMQKKENEETKEDSSSDQHADKSQQEHGS